MPWFRIKRRRKPSRQYLAHKEEARKLVKERLEYWNQFYNFKYNKVFIKNTKSRWGSCSKKGNLNFNYRIALIEPVLADYIIVHELCHIGEFNHSPKFWSLVERTIPDWKLRRAKLMKIPVNGRIAG